MDHYKIFVACSKDLVKQRECIKAWANDYNDERNPIRIEIRTYENFGNNQEEYNQYIEKTSDIVLFVIDGKIGEKTEEELKLASACLDRNGKPKIFVFLKKFKKRNKDIQHIENIVNQYVKEYYIEYNNDEDLVSKVQKHVKNYTESLKEPIAVKQGFVAVAVTLGILFVSFCFFFSLGFGLSWLTFDKSESVIIRNNIKALNDFNILSFNYEDMTCYYYLHNDSLGNIIYDKNYEMENYSISKSSFVSALSVSTSTLVLQKYIQRISKGGKTAQIITAAVYIGTFLGIVEGHYIGEQYQNDQLRKNVENLISKTDTWQDKVRSAKEARMLMQ